jgi:transposase
VFRKQEEPALFGPSLCEVVSEDHEVWALKELVDSLFASEVQSACTDRGGVPYDPATLLSVVMYGFMRGIHSTRELESACRYDVRFWALTGRNHPDHNTLHRFMVTLRDQLPGMMARVALRAKEQGLLTLRVVSVDGTKVAANVSQWKRLVDSAAELDAEELPTRQLHRLTGYMTGFNAQVAVDCDSGMIVGEALLQDGNDMHAMPAVLQSMERTSGEFPAAVVADKGYDSGETHTELARRSILGVIAPQGKEASFWNVNESGDPICPKGFAPRRKGGYTRRGNRWVRFTVRECKGCALKAACGVKDFKTIYVPQGTNVADRILNARRFESEAIQSLARTRGPTVELIFARLVLRYGLRRLSFKERSKAHAEFRMFCLAENLRILLRLFLEPFEHLNLAQACS